MLSAVALLIVVALASSAPQHGWAPRATDAVLHRTRQCEVDALAEVGGVASVTRREQPLAVVDVSLLLNEIELLEIRLYELRDVVDLFIVIEQNETYTGLAKEPTYRQHAARLMSTLGQRVMRKVVYSKCAFPRELHIDKPVIGRSAQQAMHWKREFYVRDVCAQRALEHQREKLGGDTLVLLSDMDEIPDALAVASFKYCRHARADDKEAELVGFGQVRYHFNFHCASSNMYFWTGTKLARIDDALRMGLQKMRQTRSAVSVPHGWGGWHFSNSPFGNASKLVSKYSSFAESQTIEHIKDGDMLAYWQHAMVNGGDVRSNTQCEERELRHLPRLVRDRPEPYRQLLSATQLERLID